MADMPARPDINWHDTENLAYIALALQDSDLELRDRAREALEHEADKIVALATEDAYGVALRYFPWGSNGVLANYVLTLLVVKSWKDKPEYLNAAFAQVDFIYGRNPVNVSCESLIPKVSDMRSPALYISSNKAVSRSGFLPFAALSNTLSISSRVRYCGK